MPNWIDIDVFCPRFFDKYDSRILYVGRLSNQKNLFMLFSALSGTQITLDIVGGGYLERELRLLSQDLCINVNFLGRRSNKELPEIYNRYPVFVLCSKYEGNPKSLLEAMSCGCAVIGTNVNGIKEIIFDKNNGVLVEESSHELRDGIAQLLSDIKLRSFLGVNARKSIVNNNSLTQYVDIENNRYRVLRS